MNCFVTGTDTEVGKTVASCALLHGLRARGRRAVGMKPVAAGARAVGAGWVNEDAERLLACSSPGPAYADVNPIVFEAATAPSIAARRAGSEVDAIAVARSAYARCARHAETVVVEGIGGWCVPLGPGLLLPALVRALDLPVILVAGIRLGGINHALLSARAIAADGCRLLGWIGNVLDPDYGYAEESLEALREFIAAPCLGVVPWRAKPRPEQVAPALAAALDLLAAPFTPADD